MHQHTLITILIILAIICAIAYIVPPMTNAHPRIWLQAKRYSTGARRIIIGPIMIWIPRSTIHTSVHRNGRWLAP